MTEVRSVVAVNHPAADGYRSREPHQGTAERSTRTMVRRDRRVTIIDDGSLPAMQEYINNKGTKAAGTPAFESFGSAACFLATHASSGVPACRKRGLRGLHDLQGLHGADQAADSPRLDEAQGRLRRDGAERSLRRASWPRPEPSLLSTQANRRCGWVRSRTGRSTCAGRAPSSRTRAPSRRAPSSPAASADRTRPL